MLGDEARELLGFPPSSHPTPSQVKEAYRRKVWEFHPDRFPTHEKFCAESKFKLISEAYSCLKAGTGQRSSNYGYTRVVRTGVPNVNGKRINPIFVKAPFIFIILGTVALGGVNAARAYKRQEKANPTHNPFLP